MAYEHDVFVSYKRDLETLHWLGEHFVPLLAHRLSLELGREVDIYVHEITAHIPPGASWPLELGRELASSRTLIALWTRTYFNSRWCTEEMCRMLAREKETGCRTAENSYGLVVPMVIHDGEDFPQDLEHVQRIELRRVYNTRMRRDSARAEELSDILDQTVVGLARAIRTAPPWRKEWPETEATRFFRAYHRAEKPLQQVIPRFQAR